LHCGYFLRYLPVPDPAEQWRRWQLIWFWGEVTLLWAVAACQISKISGLTPKIFSVRPSVFADDDPIDSSNMPICYQVINYLGVRLPCIGAGAAISLAMTAADLPPGGRMFF